MPVRVWLGGEGNNDLGRDDGSGQRDRGVLDVLLFRVRATGWVVEGKVVWSSLRKYQAGGALKARGQHRDVLNVLKLVEQAYERACEVVALRATSTQMKVA